MNTRRSPWIWPVATALLVGLVITLTVSITCGAMNIPARDSLLLLVDTLAGTHWSALSDFQKTVILELRLPRVLLAMGVGAILAQCGAVMQGLFRNPLADPGVIGVSAGAALGAIIAIAFMPASSHSGAVPVMAFIGGLSCTLLVYGLARSPEGTSVLVLLLAGIAISAFSGAAVGFISYFADNEKLRALSLWQMGSLAGGTPLYLTMTLCCLMVLAWRFQYRARAMNALLLGEAEARHLGIPVERLKLELIVLTAIGVGIAVAAAGLIGFVGLVIPHLVRISLGPDHRHLLPLSALAGALLLALGDLFARLALLPAELPVGLVTALLGAPFFLTLLMQQRHAH